MCDIEGGSEYKIMTNDETIKLVKEWKEKGLRIVFTNGCFDIVHLGHIDYLEKCRQLGEKLIVALNTDKSISQIKDSHRPIINQYARARIIAALQFVDIVTLFDELTPIKLIESIKPNFLVKVPEQASTYVPGQLFFFVNSIDILCTNSASTTSAPSPVRDIVKKSVAAGLTQSQTRAIQNECTSDVPIVGVAREKEALTWLQSLDKKTILHWYGNSYIVPSTFNHQYNSMLWLQEYSTLPWTQWDNFSQWLKAGRLITISMTCSCRSNLKTYVCKYAIGLMMHFGCYIVKDLAKLQNFQKRRGRPRKVGNALSDV
ncbi:unnamed protein product [Didymodactylos carnosus]|uniref:Cytidyltransferase-like domain-containing protein n=1 Tax=Didymodactylos carnosus TaxID=1234261 RepID=A0A814HJ64_9BILA|nr:unnamed protein product [Didymodactylos carnosus]CAF3781642.1 unnamed protein product [Didymodactylos carnosus]